MVLVVFVFNFSICYISVTDNGVASLDEIYQSVRALFALASGR